jgi:hypothetical protein
LYRADVSDTPLLPKVVRREAGIPGPAFFGLSLKGRVVALAFVLTIFAVVGGAAYWGALHHPDYSSPRGTAAQARMIEVFGSSERGDEVVVGDYAIERFYALDLQTGQVFVADLCKGRVRHVVEWTMPDGTLGYTLDLDRRGIQADVLRTLVAQPDDGATYLGVRVQGGPSEAFPLNYDGRLPRDRSTFRSPQGQDAAGFLRRIASGAWRPTTHLLNNDGTNYVLTSTETYPYFTVLFGLKNVLLLSHLQFVDGSDLRTRIDR